MSEPTARVDTVIFDLDGTLVDSVYHHALAWNRAFRQCGHVQPTWRIHRHIGMGGDRLVAAVAGDRVEEELGDDLREAWESEYDAMLEEPQLLPGAREVLSELRSRGINVVLASSSIPRHAQRALDLLDADSRADATATAEDADSSKPDPELLETAAGRVDASASILVGDSVWDVEAGHRAGIRTVGVLSGGYAADELREAGATWIMADPADLLEQLDEVLAPA